MFGGFRESQDFEMGFARAQKPWAKRIKKLEKAKAAFHKACRKEHMAREREAHAQGENPDITIEKQRKIQDEREIAQQKTQKVRARYEKVLEEVTRYAPRYMEEMESIFDQSQEEERKRISFLKQAFLSIHRHLDVTNNESVKAVYNELHDALMAINDQEDLRWWKNTHGPGMPTDWPQFQEWIPDKKLKKGKKALEQKAVVMERGTMIGGVRVRALYDYVGQEPDELSFKTGEEFVKIEDEDDQAPPYSIQPPPFYPSTPYSFQPPPFYPSTPYSIQPPPFYPSTPFSTQPPPFYPSTPYSTQPPPF
ncbi:hypothetical protein QTP70_034430 [Hemibagrus guttatus]|uniref:F-BAR domain-containing protein n=1 Tax=Hemibagrus guttatus TaxID=175788 RepID=A0AAE0QIE0_9TELE|nr:hypothetical protein QTP70_034430 [Hemibagrus guttatus]